MKALLGCALAGVVLLSGLPEVRSSEHRVAAPAAACEGSAREKLIGAWRLVSLEEPGPDGKLERITDRKGMLLYTRDGHMSVQLMLPEAEAGVSNDYVQNGYEGSFGSYEVNEETHTVTHHVEGSVTRGLVGKNLPRAFQFSGGRLIIQSTRPDERWSVTWEHY